MESSDDSSKKSSVWQKCEIFINTANHCLIAITTFYLVWYCLQSDSMFDILTQHAWITTIGYQVLMAEGIMTMYKANSLTFLSSRAEKKSLHVILQVIGSVMALYGCSIEIYNREKGGQKHFSSLHSLYGLVSMIFLCISMVSGLTALFAFETRKFLKPVVSKFSHNLLSLAAFVTGIISVIYVWVDKRWARTHDPGDLRYMSAWCLGFLTFFTCIGALRSLWYQFCGCMKLLTCSPDKEEYEDNEKQ